MLTCSDPRNSEAAYLSNGLIGVRIGRDGTGADEPFLIAGRYDKDETIIPFPNPLKGTWGLDPSSGSNYEQELDMRTGVLSTSWTEQGHDDIGKETQIQVLCTTVVHPSQRVIARRWRIDLHGIANLRYSLGGQNLSMGPVNNGKRRVLGFAAGGVLEQTFSGFQPTFSDESFYPGGPVPKFDEVWDFSPGKSDRPITTYDEVASVASDVWKKRWRTDILVDGPVEDQRAIHSWMFYLWSSISPGAETAIAPMGLCSDTYKCHVFWDADIWVFPALAFVDPVAAETISDYRISHQPASGVYPWESALSGRELAPLGMYNAKHVTGDVAWMLQQAAALGLAPPEKAGSIGQMANQTYLKWAKPSPDGLVLQDVRGPDEYHIGDNDLYTNCLAQALLDRFGNSRNLSPYPLSTAGALEQGGRSPNLAQTPKYHLPHDAAGLLSMDGDKVNYYGQADAVLAIYPLQNEKAEGQAKQMMLRFPPKTSDSTPAMTNSMQALIWARLGQTEKAYAEWEKSWRDFSDHPLNLFGEERRKNRTYFTTGAAGCLQTVLYGFLGFRIDWKKHQGAVWTKILRGENWLTIQPHLPQQWKRVTFRNFALLGQHYTLTVTQNGTTVTEGER